MSANIHSSSVFRICLIWWMTQENFKFYKSAWCHVLTHSIPKVSDERWWQKRSFIYDVECCFQHEIILTRQLQHPNILPYHAAFVSGPEVIVVAPLMAFGSCKDLLSSHFTDGLPEAAIAFILRDVLQGLDYIHRKGYIHRYERLNITWVNIQWGSLHINKVVFSM